MLAVGTAFPGAEDDQVTGRIVLLDVKRVPQPKEDAEQQGGDGGGEDGDGNGNGDGDDGADGQGNRQDGWLHSADRFRQPAE